MTVVGLWHGASMTMIVWGAYHGCLLILERLARRVAGQTSGMFTAFQGGGVLGFIGRAVGTFVTFFAVCMGWIIFRAEDFSSASLVFRMLSPNRLFDDFVGRRIIQYDELWYIAVFLLFHLLIFVRREVRMRYPSEAIERMRVWIMPLGYALMLFFIVTSWESKNVFIYFQF